MALDRQKEGAHDGERCRTEPPEGPAILMPGPEIAARGVRSSVSKDGEPLASVRQVDAKPSELSKKGD
jgi:hypothetical protein